MHTLDPQSRHRTQIRSGPKLSPKRRKALLVTHLITAIGLLGVHIAVLVLTRHGAASSEPITVYPAAELLCTWLLLPLAVLSWTSGVALGLLTPWRVFKHWWTTLKFGANSVGLILAFLVLRPELHRAADAAREGDVMDGGLAASLVKSSTGATVVLTLAVVVSVFKPFGRIRKPDRLRRREAVSVIARTAE